MLDEYKKRDFTKTGEPEAELKPYHVQSEQSIYVIQKHKARWIHFNFRFEHDGVLKSWAVPKWLSDDQEDKSSQSEPRIIRLPMPHLPARYPKVNTAQGQSKYGIRENLSISPQKRKSAASCRGSGKGTFQNLSERRQVGGGLRIHTT